MSSSTFQRFDGKQVVDSENKADKFEREVRTNNEMHSLIVAGQSALLRTASGELVPDSVLRVEKFEEQLSLLTVVLLKSDKTSLLMAQKRPDEYWHKIQLLVFPYICPPLSDLNCKVQFYKLLDSYKYMLTNLIEWPPQSLQRLWPFFTIFHSFPDLTPFCVNIVKLRVQYDLSQKSIVNWVTGCDLVAYRSYLPPGFSSTPAVVTLCTPRPADYNREGDKLNLISEVDGETGNRSTPQSNSELTEGNAEKTLTNGCEPCKCEPIPTFDVKSIVKDIISKLSISKENTISATSVTQSPVSHCIESLKTDDNDSISKSSINGTQSDASDTNGQNESVDGGIQVNSLNDQILIVDCVKYHMKNNELFLNFQRPKFWLKVKEEVATRMKTEPFDVESVFERFVKEYMDILKYREQFYCDSRVIELMWPLFSYIHALDISHFLPSFEIDEYRRAKEEI